MVGGKRVRITVAELDDCYGRCSFDGTEIQLSPDVALDRKMARETLRHELLHSAMKISGVSFCERFEEEALVRCIENIYFPTWDKLEPALQ